MTAESTQVQVRLTGVPLQLRARAAEYDQDLLRELALVRMSAEHDASTNAPALLLDLADEVRSTYGSVSAGPNAELDAALDRGEGTYDVVYTVPAEIRSFLRRVQEVLEEVDRFCREGRYLLILPAPAEVAAYRRWLFREFDRQLTGCDPVPWSESPESLLVTDDG